MSDLTTVDNVKQWLNLASPVSDELLARLVSACSTFVESWLNRTIAQQRYTETRNGSGTQRLMLQNFPVTAVDSVAVDGIVIPRRVNGGCGYAFDEWSVMLVGPWFPRGFANVVISYTAGYVTTPPDLEQAVIDMIGDWFKYRDRIGKTAEGIEGQTISFVNQPIPARTLGVLQQYRAVVPQ